MPDALRRARKAHGRWSVAAHQRRHDRTGDVEFIHLNKTGGSSVEKALGLPFSHQTAAARVALLGPEEWNRRYSFTFVRNPWDRIVSQYHYRKSRGRLRTDLTFREWIKATLVDKDEEIQGWSVMFMGQLERIEGTDGAVLVDEIYRFESFEQDFGRLCRRLQIDALLPHKKPSSHGHFAEYYDAATLDVVGRAFQRDVEFFGYRPEQ